MRLSTVFLVLFLVSAGIGWGLAQSLPTDSFAALSPEEKHDLIIAQRDQAIAEAKERGDYRCCIEPPCTMCYMEANQWNNQTAGTCACDDLIADGKEPCPQCKNGFCSSSEAEDAGFCEVDIQ